MDVKVLENNKKEGKISFIIEKSSPAFANMLRRTIVDEVPTMAIEFVEFRKNNSILYDEIVAHRLGAMPLKTDLKAYTLPENCKCEGEGCAKCQLKLTLKGKGPGIVYASEIKSMDPKVVPVFPETPIVKLTKGQSIELEATAVLGKGKEHAKWSPGMAYYRYKPNVEIKGSVKEPETIEKVCPRKVFEVKGGKLAVKKETHFDCNLCGACVDMAPENIKLNESDEAFIFNVESWGQLAPKQMVEEALKAFESKLDDFTKLIKK